jgi:hypothetical protein
MVFTHALLEYNRLKQTTASSKEEGSVPKREMVAIQIEELGNLLTQPLTKWMAFVHDDLVIFEFPRKPVHKPRILAPSAMAIRTRTSVHQRHTPRQLYRDRRDGYIHHNHLPFLTSCSRWVELPRQAEAFLRLGQMTQVRKLQQKPPKSPTQNHAKDT